MQLVGALNHHFIHDLLGDELWSALGDGTQPTPAVYAAATARLRTALVALAAYVPAPVLRDQLARPQAGRIDGAFWQGSILFADLSGFTALSGQLSSLGKQGAEELSALITQLFGALSEEVHAHGGSLLKFGGDALTAFFDAASLAEAHAPLAAAAALAMQQRMADFAAVVTPVGTFTLRLRIGVHSGPVFAAQVGDASHIELVVTGHTINRVATAQEIAEPGEVVISEATAALLWRPHIMPRQAGFLQLQALPLQDGAVALGSSWPLLGQTAASLPGLVERIIALQPYLPYSLPQRFLKARPAQIGEFRPVTTIFVNFWPFSELLDQLNTDATTAALALNAYYRRAQSVIHHYGGIVNKVDLYTHGDKLMALFGAPLSHEDDPERALRCALDLRAALEAANQELVAQSLVPLSQKIGLSTGTVFAGVVGGPSRHEYTVMGQPVNLAARVMGVAAPGTVVMAPTSARAVNARATLRALPPVVLKGVDGPVALAEAVGMLEDATGLALTQGSLVGRSSELAQIRTVAAQALAGVGQVVALVGPAGTGKSRLVEELLHELASQATLISAASQSYTQISPASTLRTLLRALLAPALAATDPVEALRQYLEVVAPTAARFAPLLGELLGLALTETTLTSALTAEQRAERLRELVLAAIHGVARFRPLVLVLDDLHWADAFSLDLLTALAAGVETASLLVILVYRPEPGFAEPWADHAHCLRLEL